VLRCWNHDEIVVEQVSKRPVVRGEDPAGQVLAKLSSAWPMLEVDDKTIVRVPSVSPMTSGRNRTITGVRG
jgi:hypothetical protein